MYVSHLSPPPPPLSRPLQVLNDNSRIVAIAAIGTVYAAVM
jgi:hypothetical protein